MNRTQYESLKNVEPTSPMVSAAHLDDTRDRTLLYGYTTERCTHHVYMMEGEIHLIVYDGVNVVHYKRGQFSPDELVPSKRLYPEKCDYAMCALLTRMGACLPFTKFDEEWERPTDPAIVPGARVWDEVTRRFVRYPSTKSVAGR